LRRVMRQAAPSGSGRERLVEAVGLICIPRAKGRVRLRVFAARADPLDEQASPLGDQHEVFHGQGGTNERRKLLLASWFQSARAHLAGPARDFGTGDT
jgi:hypothetical protein